MPALPADILRATRQARIVTRSDATIQTAFPGARDAIERPEPGYFEDAADAQSALALKASLIGVHRRRFAVSIADEVWIDPFTGIPTWHLTDSETGADVDALLTRIEVDMENERTSAEVMG
jgi:hypothetical protein